MSRPGRLETFLKIALIVSERSTCKKYKVGCIIVDNDNDNIISIGYNGTPSGCTHCADIESEDHKLGALELHAEINALAKVRNIDKHPLVIYNTHKPCLNCAKTIVAFKEHLNIVSIVYMFDFKDKYADEEDIEVESFLASNGISIQVADNKFTDELIKITKSII